MPNQQHSLKASGLKVTTPRLKILEIFQTSKAKNQPCHLGAEDVYKILLNEHIEIGIATIYRVLMQFEQAGLLKRNHFEHSKATFELNEGSHHDHLVCIDCGRVEEFFDEAIEERQKAIAKERGFILSDHSLALYANCQKKICPHRS